MWAYAAAVIAALVVVVGIGHQYARRKRRSDSMGVGKLSDAWLAERRRSAD